jgi:hypothetical protein
MEGLRQYFQYYTPGNHWVHLDYLVSKENPMATSVDFAMLAKEKLLALIPVYQFIIWQADNNYMPSLQRK